jgi:hypothetical protein
MERKLKEVFREAVQLPEGDRATLAGLLIETLDPRSEPDVEATSSAELERRLAEIDAGTVELKPRGCSGRSSASLNESQGLHPLDRPHGSDRWRIGPSVTNHFQLF